MDGYTLVNGLIKLLSESTSSTWMEPRFTYDLIYQAAVITAAKTNALISTQDITTVDGTSAYDLNPNFHRLYLMDDQNRYFIKVYDGTNYYFKYFSSYDSIYLANNTAEVAIPDTFTIVPKAAISQITGTATSTTDLVSGYTLFGQTLGDAGLTDSATDLSNVLVGDQVYNIYDGSNGVVVALSSAHTIICALFGGTHNYFTTTTDSYIINPQAKYQLILDPTCSTSGYTVTIPYIAKPTPIYSYYRKYNFPSGYEQALIQYAAWLFKYRDREPNFGDAFFRNWTMIISQLNTTLNQGMKRGGFGVNLMKRASKSYTYR